MQIVFALVVMISFTVAANLLMKIGAMSAPSPYLLGLASWKTLAGVTAFGCAGIVYAWVLKWLPLNVAQSFAAAQFVSVILASSLLLSEWIPPARWLGIILIAFGIAVVGVSSGGQTPDSLSLNKTERLP